MNQLISQGNQLATTTVDVTRWCQQLERNLSQSLRDVEFFVAYNRTKGKDLSRFIDNITTRVNADTEFVNTWVDIWSKYCFEKNGFNKIVRACSKINKTRAKAEVKRVKDQAKAEARQAKAQVKVQATSTLETCACGCRLTKNKMAKHLKTKMHLNLLATKEVTPTQALMERLNKIEADMDKFSKQMKEDVKHLAPLPTPSTTIGSLTS